MKKLLLLSSIFFSLFFGCTETKKEEHKIEVDNTEHKHEKEKLPLENIANNNWINDIKLDSGNKWAANIETTNGVNAMLNKINESSLNSVDDYLALANKLNVEKNTLVKECTMTGSSHDNLHIFLHPLIEKINHLSNTTSTNEGSEITKSITENLNAYFNYFN